MNATSLYVSTSRLVLQADDDSSSWQDLYRLVPYLRQSLSCTVCGNLLIEPYTPTETNCQHHVCRTCKGGRKNLKPSCSWCKDYDSYVENVLLRILLQCYKKLCMYITSTTIYKTLMSNNSCATSNGNIGTGTSSLVELINEGAGFKDDYKSTSGLSKSAYSILPCVYTTSSTQTASTSSVTSPVVQTVDVPAAVETRTTPHVQTNGSSIFSLFNIGNKSSHKQKGNSLLSTNKEASVQSSGQSSRLSSKNSSGPSFKKPQRSHKLSLSKGNLRNKTPPRRQAGRAGVRHSHTSSGAPTGVSTGSAVHPNAGTILVKRRGCRCGNATATPGKLTCCGQRCPCYVDSKACLDCRCKGCRNPHRPGGHKVRPLIPELETYQMRLGPVTTLSDLTEVADCDPTDVIDLGSTECVSLASPEQLAASNAGATVQVLGVYTTQLHSVSSALPATLLVGDEATALSRSSEEDTESSDVDVDC